MHVEPRPHVPGEVAEVGDVGAALDGPELDAERARAVEPLDARLLARASVICATAAGADTALLGDMRLDLVVLDEATQAPDPIALVVLAGDPCPLPPTVIDPHAARDGLAVTLFERLAAARPETRRMLVVQHRMYEALMAFPSATSYEGKLVAHPSVAAHRRRSVVIRTTGRFSKPPSAGARGCPPGTSSSHRRGASFGRGK